MNDPLPPLTDDDLSAHLDGETDPALAARLEADPAAQARLEQLRSARILLAGSEPDPLDPHQVEALIQGALAPETTAVPRPRRKGPPAGLVAAVVLVLLGVGLALVWSGTRADRDEAATREAAATATATDSDAPTDALAESGADAQAGDGAKAGAASPTTLAGGATEGTGGSPADVPITLTNLGSFDTPEALRSSLAEGFPPATSTGTITGSAKDHTDATSIQRCSDQFATVLSIDGPQQHVGVATVGGDIAVVYEFPAPPETSTTAGAKPATTLTVAVTPKACDDLFIFQR